LNHNDFYDLADGPALAFGRQGTKNSANWPEFPGDGEQGALGTFFLSHVETTEREDRSVEPPTTPNRSRRGAGVYGAGVLPGRRIDQPRLQAA